MKNKIAKITIILLLLLTMPGISGANKVRYDDPDVPKELNTLRKFRDFHLKKYSAGMAFIRYYYRYGPVAADAIRKRDRLRSLVRLSLLPLMYAGRNFNGVLIFLAVFSGFMLFMLLWYIYLKYKKAAPEHRRVTI